MKRFSPVLAAGLILAFGLLPRAWAAPAGGAKARAALGILRAECLSCHGETKQKGGLSLLSREAVLRGGDEGPAAESGHPERSKLLQFLQVGADPHMPPKKQLEPEQIRALRDWIRAGLPWDATALSEEEAIQPVTLSHLPETYHPVVALAMSPDGHHLAFGQGGSLSLYSLAETNLVRIAQVAAHEDAIQSLAWSPDGRRLASGGFRKVRLWDGHTLDGLGEWSQGLAGRITAMDYAPDGTTLAIADRGNGQAGFLRLLSTNQTLGSPVASWRAHRDTVYDLEFSRDGSRLLTAGGDQLVKVWDTTTRAELAVLEGHTAQVLAAAFNTNATQVVSGGADRQLKVWDIATREKIISLGNPSSAINAVEWPGDGAAILAATDSGTVLRYTHLKSHTGEQSSASGDEQTVGTAPSAALSIAGSPDGTRIAAGTQDGGIRVWDKDGKLVAEVAPAPGDTARRPRDTAPPRRPPSPESAPLPRNAKGAPRNPVLPTPREVRSLFAEPAALLLTADSPRRNILITAQTDDGFEMDATDDVPWTVSPRAPFRLGPSGVVEAVSAGSGILTARYGGREIEIPVTVAGNGAVTPTPPSFVRDVLPALSQSGCSAGACHAKPEGQNGFKLSVFSYDPKADYWEIVQEARGRRIFPAAPDESLLLLKPLGLVPHEGGQRFARNSETHDLLTRWIRSGMPYALTKEPALRGISVLPAERRYRKGATQRLLVLARYSDGSVRDVTRLASYDTNDREMARVEEPGRISVGQLTGQGVVVARYMGFVADSRITVPAEHLLPAESYAALPANNFIDRLAYEQFQRLGLFPSDLCSDAEFLRRAKLDAVGLLPTPEEVRAFLADPSPDKRRRFIARVLEDPAYADFWANKWADLLRPNPDRVGVKSVFVLDQWIRERFRAHEPYNEFVREILLAEGSNHRTGPAVIYRDRRDPPELTTMFSQLFLGTRLECAKCHHHPNERWSQDDFYQFAAFFGPVKQKGAGLSPPISAGTESFYYSPGGTVKNPVSGEVMTPRAPDGPEIKDEGNDPRRKLVDWLTSPGNPFFARAAVNRVWAGFFGRGLVHPVDDFRSSNPCVNPALLDALAADFESNGYDLRHLIRTILESRLYQLGTEPNASNVADTRNFSRAYRRRLPAEVMVDAVRDATGVPDTFAAMPAGGRAMQTWSYKIESHFLDAFGRPNSSSDCPCERDTQLSVVQSLHLMNSKALQAKLSDPAGRVHALASGTQTPEEITTELYLRTLSRPPSAEELGKATAAFAAPGATRQTAAEDVFWSLLNSPEFILNH
ncbi:MAG: DUF1553 domain-containing protein [Verrucomicrobiales bacterium]|nr:DUF1553 domain-containing protein [Verrucomicrobiales bacterium]